MLNQSQTPLLTALKNCTNQPDAPFYAPGHKRGQGISPLLTELLGTQVFHADLPELPELDNLFNPEAAIQEAQTLAAEAFGAEKTWFLVNGSTAGILAAILATCGTGDKIILPRNVHQSVISALVLSGAIAIFLQPEYDPHWDLPLSITPEALASALEQHPDTKAVFVVYPTYQGICGDLEQLASITHQYNIPLLVDEAHGPHFAFHPDFPKPALAAGADLTVQSTHKVLGAMTQASMLHIQGNRIDCDRLNQTLQFVQSTSPSYLLLASLDAARHQIATQGRQLMNKTLELADIARSELSLISGLSVLSPPPTDNDQTDYNPGFVNLDRTRLTVNISHLGLSGYEADTILHQHLGVTAELPSLKHLTFIISLGNTQTDIDQLVQAFTTLAQTYPLTLPSTHLHTSHLPSPSLACNLPISPRNAFFAPTEHRPLSECVGCLSAEIICPYPPGIPILLPGEPITPEALNFLHQVQAFGGKITGCSDPNLQTLKVLKLLTDKEGTRD